MDREFNMSNRTVLVKDNRTFSDIRGSDTWDGESCAGWIWWLSWQKHMVAPSVTYLEVIFFVWLSGIPFITGHLSTKEKGKNYPWIHVKPSMSMTSQPNHVRCRDSTVWVQTHSTSVGHDNAEDLSDYPPCPDYLHNATAGRREQRNRAERTQIATIIPEDELINTFFILTMSQNSNSQLLSLHIFTEEKRFIH